MHLLSQAVYAIRENVYFYKLKLNQELKILTLHSFLMYLILYFSKCILNPSLLMHLYFVYSGIMTEIKVVLLFFLILIVDKNTFLLK